MVTTNTLIENTDARNYFIAAIQSPAHNQIVYHTTNRHSRAGITAGTGEYSTDNPGSGASEAGLGNNGTIVTAAAITEKSTTFSRIYGDRAVAG